MGACRKKPAQPASGTLSWMTPSETLLRLCLGGFGKIFAKQRLLLALSDFTGPFSRPKNPSKTCHHKGPPCTPYPTTPCDFVRRCPCTTIHAKTSRKHLFSTSELQRGCCAGSKKLVRHFENAPDWNVFATSRSSSKKMAYETCSSQNVQAHPEV